MARPQDPRYLGAILCALAATYVACSGYDGSNRVSKPPQLIPDADYGGAPTASAGASPGGDASTPAGAAGAPSAGTGGAGTSEGGASSGGPNAAGSAGTSSGGPNAAGSAGTSSGGTNSAGTSSGGANVAGSAGTAAGGTGGAVLAGGSGGDSATDPLISQGKTATADSEETGHLAALGNDGAADTRWCAANGAVGHYWQVDLGKAYVLSKIGVTWEKAMVYQFKVEGSLDGTNFSAVLDQTQSTNAAAAQTYALGAGPSARYVRITTTTLPSASIWASFFEFQVYGH